MNKLVVVVATLVAGFLILEQGLALKCFVCNSFHQADCADWFDNVTQHLVQCKPEQKKCRKIVQEVWLEDHWDVRYIRHCATNGEIGRYEGRECQEMYGTYNIRVRHCHCDNQDGCNSSPHSSSSSSLFTLLSIGVAVLLLPHVRWILYVILAGCLVWVRISFPCILNMPHDAW